MLLDIGNSTEVILDCPITESKVSGALSIWKEWLNDIRRKQRSNSHDGSNDYTDRGTAEYHGRDASGCRKSHKIIQI